MAKNNKDIVISFRLKKEEFEPFRELLEKSDKSKSEFFRDIFLAKEKNINVTFNELKPFDYYNILRVVNKSGNNLNQLAKHFNFAYKAKLISESTYLKGVNLLISINEHLKRSLNDS
ncbi:relaxosome protein [Bisgaard Taxon 10/6]|uniref:plasmid mobilization protein n=1 Tax=Exercitatus varius TaxID=67857 RepID=UPI00294AF45E|nr:relaxosome protein [Exercitatus varius]MDG2957059.1 relaxosome protein [Exercitatus varius]MDG2965253.1 relaxosome protein [Exercitatus varius]